MKTVDEILGHALELSNDDRAALVHRLLQTLECEQDLDDAWLAAWEPELLARITAYERGETAARDWRESLAHARQVLRDEESAS